MRPSLEHLILTGVLLVTPAAVAAPERDGTQRLSAKGSSAPVQETGRVLILTFRDGEPAANVAVSGSFGAGLTRADGSFAIEARGGSHFLTAAGLEKRIDFRVVPGEETQISVHLLGPDPATVNVAEPASEDITNRETSLGPPVDLQLFVSASANARPVEGATILISGQEAGLVTDPEGVARARLPAGSYSVSVFHPAHRTKTLTHTVKHGGPALRVVLEAASAELEDVVVLAPKVKGSVSALVEVRRQASAVTDVLGSEQMSRAGDGDAGSSLRRVTGLTLVGGKFVYVRGLGERYSGVQMNQFGLPSPEPARRVVPLDLFPTAILESVLVQKSYTPDLPAEFGGGLIQLQTRSLPEKRFFRASLSANYEPIHNRLSYQGGSTDWLGLDDGGRQMPRAIRAALASGQKLVPVQPGSSDGISQDRLAALGQSLSNNYATQRTSDPGLPGVSLAAGDRFRLGGVRWGVASSLLYGQGIESNERLNRGFNVGRGSELTPDFEERVDFAETETRLVGSFDLGAEITEGHQVSFSTFLLRHTTDTALFRRRVGADSPSQIESTTLDWTERQLWPKHFKGRHDLGQLVRWPVEMKWRLGWSDATRESPDRREYAYERIDDSYQIRGDSGGNRRTFSELEDRSREVGTDLTIPLAARADLLKLKIGASRIERERRSDVFRLFFARDFQDPTTIDPSLPPESQFQSSNIGPGRYQLQNLTDAADSYGGSQSIDAQYAMLEFAPMESWLFQAGARRERSVQNVSTFQYFAPSSPFATSELEMNNLLPAYSVLWKPGSRLRARWAYSETLARPDFRELSEVGFIDDETGNDIRGNARLKGTVIRNIDHRWDYYFTTDEYVSLGGFHKTFESPIEVMFVPGVNRIQTFDNARAARNYGVEFETRFGLRHMTRALRRWSVLSNLTLIRSQIELDDRNRGIQTSDSRPLQGQAPYMVNFQLQYDRPVWGLSSTLLYAIVGSRITEVGTNRVPDTYEQPFHQLDFVASKSIDKKWSVAFRARNLLNPEIQARQGNEIVRSFRRGTTAGLSLNGVF